MRSIPRCSRCLCFALPWLAVAALMALPGCNSAAVKRGRVHGTVTVDGAPLAKGQIRILAVSEGGIGTAGEVVDGKYDIPPERGPTAGTYRVEIVSLKSTGRRVRDSDTNEMVDEVVNTLPARYNSASTLQIKYDPGGDQAFTFDLKKK